MKLKSNGHDLAQEYEQNMADLRRRVAERHGVVEDRLLALEEEDSVLRNLEAKLS